MTYRWPLTWVVMAIVAVTPLATHADQNLLEHTDFEMKDDRVVGWKDWTRPEQQISVDADAGHADGKPALRVGVSKDGGKRHGQIIQVVKAKPNTTYRLDADVKSSKSGMAYLQVKLLAGKQEGERISTAANRSTGNWESVSKEFTTEADTTGIQVLCRFRMSEPFVNATAWFADPRLVEVDEAASGFTAQGPTAVPTFNSVGLYWKPEGGSAERPVSVSYRAVGEPVWREALPLWFDPNTHTGDAASHSHEYRGSIVHLQAGTEYEVKLELDGADAAEHLTFTTWSEEPKIARIVTLPASHSDGYQITEGGSAETGYVLYRPAEGETPIWDAQGKQPYNLRIDASYVIVRGLTFRNAAQHGIVLGDVHHVIIEDCDISGWGRTGDDGQAKDLDSAIFSKSPGLEHVVIQRCEIHHPRSDSNSWSEKRPGTNSSHPQGPQAITFRGGMGRYVIRYNRIHSDIEHMFNDGMGEVKNGSYGGFPNRDSDIHDNFVSHCWDDGIEIEGADMNVRVWNNYVTMTYGAIGAASPSLGPVYFWRNVYAVSRKHSGDKPNDYRGHFLVKLGQERPQWGRGRMFIFHNTTLQPPGFEGFTDPTSGAQAGLVFTSDRKQAENIVSRNNILHTRHARDWAIRDTQETPSNDYDYDLYNGRVRARPGAERHGIVATPVYDRAPDGRLWLRPSTPGHDAGVRIPNFNDEYVGSAPDMGAVETGCTRPKPPLWPDFPPPHE